MAQELEPSPSPHRWLTYYPICLAAIGVVSIVVGAAIILGPALGAPLEGLLGLAFGTLYVGVAMGLAERKRWAWRVNQWGLLLIQPITLAAVLGLWQVQRFPLLLVWRSGMALFLGLWSVLNMRYFQKRRHLFDATGATPPSATP